MSGLIQRLGMFGGSFDPPHNTHVALIETAVAQLALDQIRVFPTGQAWHKARTLSPAHDRLAMAQLAFGELERVVVDDREIRRDGPTWTIDTLRELHREFPGARLFLIIGGDQAAALTSWREWREIIRIATVSVAGRPDSTGASAAQDRSDTPSGSFEALQLPPASTSATDIRQRVSAHKGVAHLVPDAVARYIDQHHLYLPP